MFNSSNQGGNNGKKYNTPGTTKRTETKNKTAREYEEKDRLAREMKKINEDLEKRNKNKEEELRKYRK